MKRIAALRAILVATLTLLVMALQPAPARAGLGECLASAVDAQGQLAQIAATAAATAGCVGAASSDPIMVATIVALSALAVDGQFSGSDQCHAMINGAVGKLIATALIESGIAGVLGDDFKAKLISFAEGNAGAALEQLVPPLTPYLTCGCTVAGAAGDMAAAVKALEKDAKACINFAADVAEAFIDGVESGIDAVGEFFEDAWCSLAGCPKPPVMVDCISAPMPDDNIAYFIEGGGIAMKSAYDDGATPWKICACPTPMVMREVQMGWGTGWQCGCADSSEHAFGPGICACQGDQHHVQVGGNVTECRSCPPGSKMDPNTGACACGAGEMLAKTYDGTSTYAASDSCAACPANGAKQGMECIICDPSKGQVAKDNWGIFESYACGYCGSRQQVAADGHSCTSCGTDQYLDASNQCQSCPSGEVLSQDGKSCFKPADVCRPDQVAKEYVVTSYNNVGWVGHTCSCADGQTEYNGKCVAQLTCNDGQIANYDTGHCDNRLFCGVGQVVKMIDNGTGPMEVGYVPPTYACVTCGSGTWADQEHNTCTKCPGGSVSIQAGTCTCGGDFANAGGVCRPCAIGWHATATFGFNPATCVKDEDTSQKSCGLRAIKTANGSCEACKRGEMAIMNHCVSMTVPSKIPVPDNPLKTDVSLPVLLCGPNEVPDDTNGGCRPCGKDATALGGECVPNKANNKPVAPNKPVSQPKGTPKLADCPVGTTRIDGQCVRPNAPKGQREVPKRAGGELNCGPRMRPNPSNTRCVPDLDADDDGPGGGSRPGGGKVGPSGTPASPSSGGGRINNYNSKPF